MGESAILTTNSTFGIFLTIGNKKCSTPLQRLGKRQLLDLYNFPSKT